VADWTRPDPNRDLSFFKPAPGGARYLPGVDDQVSFSPVEAKTPEPPVQDRSYAEAAGGGPQTILPLDDKPSTATAGRKKDDQLVVFQDQKKVTFDAAALKAPSREDTGMRTRSAGTVEQLELSAPVKVSIEGSRELKGLQTSYNPVSTKLMSQPTVVEPGPDGEDIPKEVHFVFNTELASDFGEPKDLHEALNGPDAERWKPSIGAEIMNFIKRKSWIKVPRSEAVASGKTTVGTKLVFKVKTEQDAVPGSKLGLFQKASSRSQVWTTLSPPLQWQQTQPSGWELGMLCTRAG